MRIDNKKAYYDYQLFDRIQAGIKLTGPEVKAVRFGHADLSGSHVRIIDNQMYLINAKIFPYKYARNEGFEEKRTRKLLLHKKEIIALKSKIEGSSLTIVPVFLYNTAHIIKLELALARSKKKYQKKEAVKKLDIQRQTEEELNDWG